MSFKIENLHSLFKLAVKHNASDLHIRSNEPPALRIRGALKPIESKAFVFNDILDICKLIISDEKILNDLENVGEYDGSISLEGVCRARFNYFQYRQGRIGITFRVIKTEIPTVEGLKLAPILNTIALQTRGLILVTGATGSGKSTTLASMVNHINETKACHIITLEDPIEFLYDSKKARITQREIGIDSKDFDSALKGALRQDPDVILIGELRDADTIAIALKAAETGHAVLATVHTTNAVSTINRMISMFPAEEQVEVRKRLATSIYATISQRMLKGVEKGQIHVAQEIMITSPGIKECIEGKEPLEKIHTIISMTGDKRRGAKGNQSFDDEIYKLLENKKISEKIALESVDNQPNFIQRLSFGD